MGLFKSAYHHFRLKHRNGVRLASILLALLFIITPVSGCGDVRLTGEKAAIEAVYGQFFPGRAIEINGSLFGQWKTQERLASVEVAADGRTCFRKERGTSE